MGLRLGFRDRMGEGQVIHSLEVGHPAFATATDDAHHADGRASECRVVFPIVNADICFFLHQLKVLTTLEEGRLILQRCPGVSSNVSQCSLPLITIVGKRARRGTLLESVNEATEKFGSLKVILGSVLAAHANREVRSFLPSWTSSFNTFLGDRRLRKKN